MTTNGTVTPPPHRSDFASGAAVRLDLPDGDRWVLVRAELTYGQQRRLETSGVVGIDPTAVARDRLKYDPAAYEIERLATWVIDWSLKDGDGDRVTVSREAIEALHPDTAAEIHAALDRHVEALEAKKGSPAATAVPGSTKPGATSSSARRSGGPGAS